MNFISLPYFLFCPVMILGYYLLPQKSRNMWLLLGSWFFYLSTGTSNFLFLLVVVAITYFGGLLLARTSAHKKKWLLGALLALFFGTLFGLKYLEFAWQLVDQCMARFGLHINSPTLNLLLPAGLSFYLFMAAGYLIDVYRGDKTAETRFIYLALFLSFFPALISGPIGRSNQLMSQFDTKHELDFDRLRSSLARFIWGVFKKLVIADRLGIFVTTIYTAPDGYGRIQVIAAACAFSVQIYCDFSAYSDMALGSASALGFDLIENFKTPYFARNIADFWRGWHVSLTSWFRDYLYIPLGGSKKGTLRRYFNILVVFAISGLWHGAALSFVVWGLLNGAYQVIGGLTKPTRTELRSILGLKASNPILAISQIVITFGLTTIAWVFFKANSLSHGLLIFRNMVSGPWLSDLSPMFILDRLELYVLVGSLVLLFLVDLLSTKYSIWSSYAKLHRSLRWILTVFFVVSIFLFGIYGTGYDPQDFIYFKF